MKRRMLLAVAVCGQALVTMPALAEINKCIVNGQAVYQAAPCQSGAAATTIRNLDVPPAEESAGERRNELLTRAANADVLRRSKGIDQQIAGLQDDIATYQAASDAEIAALKARQSLANNNLAGATLEQSLATEMGVVVAKYQGKIKLAQDRIDALRKEKASLLLK